MSIREKAPNAGLTVEQVRKVRADTRTPASAYARAWGVSAETIRKIRRGETWSWLPQGEGELPKLPQEPAPIQLPPDELQRKEDEGTLRLYELGLLTLDQVPAHLKERAKDLNKE